MKFFTPQWWNDTERIDSGPFRAYDKHLDPIREELHQRGCYFDRARLHDSSIDTVHVSDGMAEIIGIKYHNGKPFSILYHECELMTIDMHHGYDQAGPTGFGQWGYDEMDITGEGLVEHRIITSTGMEVTILCESVTEHNS